MNTGQISGGGSIDRGIPTRFEKGHLPERGLAGDPDSASISEKGREFLSTVEVMTDRLETDLGEREDLVESARRRLLSGELDRAAVFLETALGMLRSGF